jgi:uncharacterized protein DUF992
MSGGVSYFSRFFVKFVEIFAAGLASAISAYLLAYFGGVLSSTPASSPVPTTQIGSNASGVAAQPIAPVAAPTTNEQPTRKQGSPEPHLAHKAGKDPKVLPLPEQRHADTAGAEKAPRSQKSAEALVRAALANVDAKVPDTVTEATVAGTDVQPASSNNRPSPVASVDVEPPLVASAVDPLPPRVSSPLEKSAPQATTPADQEKQVRAGVLSCDISGGMGLILGSQKLVSCSFTADEEGRREDYSGSITKFGLDLGLTHGSRMVWVVFTKALAGPGFLAGDYFGATGEATVGAGVGANVLLGGSNRTVALQPISLSGQTGLNLALGVAALRLGLPNQ